MSQSQQVIARVKGFRLGHVPVHMDPCSRELLALRRLAHGSRLCDFDSTARDRNIKWL